MAESSGSKGSSGGKGIVPRLILLAVLVAAVAVFIVDQKAKSSAQSAYDSLPSPDGSDWTSDQVHEALGRDADQVSEEGTQRIEVYRYPGLLSSYPLAVRYRYDPELQAQRMVEKIVFRETFDP